MRWLNSNINSVDTSLSKLRETVKDREAGCAAVHGTAQSGTTSHTEQQQTTVTIKSRLRFREQSDGYPGVSGRASIGARD